MLPTTCTIQLSGEEFNKIHQDIKYYKFLTDDVYVLGSNVARSKQNIKFYEKSKCCMHWSPFIHSLALIDIPSDATVYIDKGKFRANKIIITHILNLTDVVDTFWVESMIKGCRPFGSALKFVKHQTAVICALAVQKDGFAIRYVKDPLLLTEELCSLAVRRNGAALQYIDIENQTKEICISAVRQNKDAIQYVKLFFTELSGADFNVLYGSDIKFYKFLKRDLRHHDHTYHLGLNINHNNDKNTGLHFIAESECHKQQFWSMYRNQLYRDKLALIEIPSDARVFTEQNKFRTDRFIIKEINNYPDVPYIFWIGLLKNCGPIGVLTAFKYIKDKTYDLCLLAVQRNGLCVQYIEDPTEELCTLAVQQNGFAIQYIKNKTYKLCVLAVEQNSFALQYISDQTEELCIMAVKKETTSLTYVKILTDAVLEHVSKYCADYARSKILENKPSNKTSIKTVTKNKPPTKISRITSIETVIIPSSEPSTTISIKSTVEFHKELTGAQFNDIYKGVKLYKFLHNNLTHYGFQYKLGLNIDTTPFKPKNTCSEGGLYFCDETTCYHHWRLYGKKVALIEIPSDAIVYVEETKFKADRLMITEIIDYDDLNDDFWINMSDHDTSALEFMKVQPYHICKRTIEQNGLAIRLIRDQTDELCKLAVKKNGDALRHVTNQTFEVCRLAVEQTIYAKYFVRDQSIVEELCGFAVRYDWRALQFVSNQTEEMRSLAIQQDERAESYFR